MFTGLIEELGTVARLRETDEGTDLIIKAEEVFQDAKLGDSIAVQGVCLTIAERDGTHATFGRTLCAGAR